MVGQGVRTYTQPMTQESVPETVDLTLGKEDPSMS